MRSWVASVFKPALNRIKQIAVTEMVYDERECPKQLRTACKLVTEIDIRPSFDLRSSRACGRP